MPSLAPFTTAVSRARGQVSTTLKDRRALAAFVLLVVPIVIVLAMGWSRRWTSDDGFINFRMVDMIRHGHGPVFNVGTRVEAETSPLWLLLLVIGDVIIPLRLEWVAVFGALFFMATGFVFAELGAARLWRRAMGDSGLLLPAGALVFAALAPVWDFSTAGLDTGLAIAWLGVCWWALCRLVCADATQDTKGRARWWICLLIGLGPLVRPDLLIMTIAFLGVLLVVESSWRHRVRVTAWIVAIPLAYQVFRMAYYAALVPNTALAKEAGTSDWSRGWTYFTDFLSTYHWWIPLGLLLVVALVPLLRSESVRGSRELTVLVVAPLVAGIVHAAYVIRVGGDFMHARMLLPSLWCFLLPGTVVVVHSWRWAGAAALAAWVVVCGLFLRVGYVVYDTTSDTTVNAKIGPSSSHALITNERGEFVEFSNKENPVTLDDYRSAFFPFVRAGEAVRQLAATGKRGVLLDGYKPDSELLPIRPGLSTPPIVAFVMNIGMYGYAAGPDVDVVDVLGIADPLGARLRVKRGTPGHEKRINPAWQVARFVERGAGPESQAVRDARRALQCTDLRELLHDVSAHLDAQQAWDNFWDSFSLTSLRIARSPSVAVRELCD